MLYPNIHCLIWSHLSLDTVLERPSNLMLEVANIWGNIYLFLSALSSWNFSQLFTHGFVSSFNIISWEIISFYPLYYISQLLPLPTCLWSCKYNSRSRFLTLRAIIACSMFQCKNDLTTIGLTLFAVYLLKKIF